MSEPIEVSDEDPNGICIVVSRRDGRVVGQSSAARALLGSTEETEEEDSAEKQLCWTLMRQVPGAKRLPCREDCVGERLSRDTPVESKSIRLRGRTFDLHCEPVGDQIITTLLPRPDPPSSHPQRLTPREVEVLRLLADGLDGTEIAETLGICQGTVRKHVEHMRESLGCRTRAGLVAKGYRLHYLE